MNVAELKLKV